MTIDQLILDFNSRRMTFALKGGMKDIRVCKIILGYAKLPNTNLDIFNNFTSTHPDYSYLVAKSIFLYGILKFLRKSKSRL